MIKNGFRTIGERKRDLLMKIKQELIELRLKGVNPTKYLKKRYELIRFQDIQNITTKRLSGIISDLRELRRNV